MEKEFTCIQKWFDEKMDQESLKHNRTVEDYCRLMNKCKVYSENVKQSRAENAPYKLLAQRLTNIIRASIGNRIQYPTMNIEKDSNKNVFADFEVSRLIWKAIKIRKV